jgi:hypothetical protein
MKKIFTLLLLFSFQFSKAQHYTQGLPFDTTLYSNGFYSVSGCTSNNGSISLDPTLFNYVSGMQFMIIIDTVYFTGPVGMSPYHAGDTVILDPSHPGFSSVTGAASFWFRIKLVGTPTTSGQVYPCGLVVNQCTCLCIQMTIAADPGSPACSVDLSNAVAEFNKPGLNVFPNPAVNTLSVNGITGKTVLQLYDAFGKLVMEQEADGNTTINTAGLTEGIYTLSVDDGKTKTFNKMLVVR